MRIEVAGIPAPQGSKRHVGGGRMVEASRAVGPWREAVRAETQRAIKTIHNSEPFTGPTGVKAWFYLPKPKSAPANARPDKRPDLDKLCRAVLDGITDGGALLDDGQVVQIAAIKIYENRQHRPGCIIEIWEA